MESPAKPGILMVGFRRSLAQALEAMHLSYSVIERKEFKYTNPYLLKKFYFSEDLFDKLAEQYDSSNTRAIIASKEWAVMPAARLRERLKIPGADIQTANLCSNKFAMKQRALAADIPVTPFGLANSESELKELVVKWGKPLVAKPQNSSGSRGLKFLNDLEEFSGIGDWQNMIFEKFIDAGEVSLESFVVDGKVHFCNLTQYYKTGHINILPAQDATPCFIELEKLNQRVIEAMGIKNAMTHAEYYLTDKGILFGEIAVRPPGGYIMEALALAYDFNPWLAFVTSELGESDDLTNLLNHRIQNRVAVHVIHPGAGPVLGIHGYENLVEDGLAHRVHLKLELGQELTQRQSLGADYGVVIQTAPDLPSLKSKILRLLKRCKIDLPFHDLQIGS